MYFNQEVIKKYKNLKIKNVKKNIFLECKKYENKKNKCKIDMYFNQDVIKNKKKFKIKNDKKNIFLEYKK